jgi:hypothetical protein
MTVYRFAVLNGHSLLCCSSSYLNIQQDGSVSDFVWQCIQYDSVPGHSCTYSCTLVLSLDLPEDILASTMHSNTVPSYYTISYILLVDIFPSFESCSFDFRTPASFLGCPGFDSHPRLRLFPECSRVY